MTPKKPPFKFPEEEKAMLKERLIELNGDLRNIMTEIQNYATIIDEYETTAVLRDYVNTKSQTKMEHEYVVKTHPLFSLLWKFCLEKKHHWFCKLFWNAKVITYTDGDFVTTQELWENKLR